MHNDSNYPNTAYPNSGSSIVKTTFQVFSTIFWTVLWVGIAILLLLRVFVYQQVNVVGHSMDPNYQEGQLLLINQLQQDLERGQVVAVYEDKNTALHANYFTRFDPTNTFFLKRVIGLPGESIEIVKSKVIIYNDQYPEGAILQEDYLSQEVVKEMETNKIFEYFPKTRIESDSYFLMGDNRTHSFDSRNKGTFPSYTVFGQEVLRYWPVDDSQMFQLPEYSFQPMNNETKEQLERVRSGS
jgi:signal peptidase I